MFAKDDYGPMPQVERIGNDPYEDERRETKNLTYDAPSFPA
jgi:hypothetical protein